MNKLEKLYKKIEDKVNNAIIQNASIGIENISKDVLLESIEENVYSNKYFEPIEYVRRVDRGVRGGYGDRENLRTHLVKKDGKLSFKTENLTTGDDDAIGERIDTIIETGSGYTWKRKPPPRPVFADAKENIKSRKGEIIEIIKKALND